MATIPLSSRPSPSLEPQVSPTKYPPSDPAAVCTAPHAVRLPHHRHLLTECGWFWLGCVAFWALVGAAIWWWVR